VRLDVGSAIDLLVYVTVTIIIDDVARFIDGHARHRRAANCVVDAYDYAAFAAGPKTTRTGLAQAQILVYCSVAVVIGTIAGLSDRLAWRSAADRAAGAVTNGYASTQTSALSFGAFHIQAQAFVGAAIAIIIDFVAPFGATDAGGG
jgi:hypothetical protein